MGLGRLSGSAMSFNLSNQQQQVRFGCDGGPDTATFTLPLLALFTSQELTVQFFGASVVIINTYNYASSTFNTPLYLNFDNLLFPATVNFGPPSGQQTYNTAQGESDDFGLFGFQYVDPGLIASVRGFGQQFPGFFAAALDTDILLFLFTQPIVPDPCEWRAELFRQGTVCRLSLSKDPNLLLLASPSRGPHAPVDKLHLVPGSVEGSRACRRRKGKVPPMWYGRPGPRPGAHRGDGGRGADRRRRG